MARPEKNNFKKTWVYTKKYLSIKCHLPKNYTLCLEVTCVNLVYFYRAQTLFQNRYIMVNYVSLKIKQIIVCHFIFAYFLFSIFPISSYTSKKCLHLYNRSHTATLFNQMKPKEFILKPCRWPLDFHFWDNGKKQTSLWPKMISCAPILFRV